MGRGGRKRAEECTGKGVERRGQRRAEVGRKRAEDMIWAGKKGQRRAKEDRDSDSEAEKKKALSREGEGEDIGSF